MGSRYVMRQFISVENYRPIWKRVEIRDQKCMKNDIIYKRSCTAVMKELI